MAAPDRPSYDRTRPPYPDALVERIIAASPGPEVLDVGCGTGIEARQFQAAGCTVLGVEPDARMAAFARRRGLQVEVATFEAWNPAGRAFDAVVAGRAWHWVDPVAGAAKAAQVLRPGGRGLRRRLPAGGARLAVQPPGRDPAAPGGLPGAVRTRAADGIGKVDRFGDPEQWRYDSERPSTTMAVTAALRPEG